MSNRPYLETAQDYGVGPIVELFRRSETEQANLISIDQTTSPKVGYLDTVEQLPLASEAYNISDRLEDYVVVPVVIMPSDLPNRNGVAFPYSELSSWDYESGMPTFKTWKGKPTFYEHNNQNPKAAKGIIFDSSIRRMKNVEGDLFKVVCLCGFDRTKDKVLVNNILTGKIDSYSMGAKIGSYSCSVCNHNFEQGGCEHLDPPRNRRLKQPYSIDGKGRLIFYNVHDIGGFETSAVISPAYVSAQTPEFIQMFKD